MGRQSTAFPKPEGKTMVSASATALAFETFGPSHLAALGAAAGLTVLLPAAGRLTKAPARRRAMAAALAAAMLLNEWGYYVHEFATRPASEAVTYALPLHVCGAVIYLLAWTLIRPTPWVFEIAWVWALAGTAQALVTPNLAIDFPSYRYWQYFLTHGLTPAAAMFAMVAQGQRPRRGALWRVFLISNAYLVFVAVANRLLGANYLFLREPPGGASPFFFLPRPWYILVLEAVGFASMAVLLLPFRFIRRETADDRGDQPREA